MSGSDRWKDRRTSAERRGRADRRAGANARPKRSAATERRSGSERRTITDRRDEASWQTLPIDVDVSQPASEQMLLDAAVAAREFAQAHYSRFKVGAALETSDGTIITGCNIENATYGLTLCAERVALVKALSDGHTAFTRIAVAAATDAPTPPCGPCRQLLWEYCGDIEVILGNRERITGRHALSALLPLPFDRRLLD